MSAFKPSTSHSSSPTMGQQYVAFAAEATRDERADFLKKTYLHLAGAVGVFVGLVAAIQSMPGVEKLVGTMVGGQWSWLIVLGVFLLVSYAAERMARNAVSIGAQYAGLGLYILAMAVITTPLIFFARILEANLAGNPPIIATAAFSTLGIFGALTAIVLYTRKDFSFLRSALMLGGLIAMGLIVCAIIFQFELGIVFTIAMIGLLALWVLYDTSNVLHHYQTGQYVVASLALFASLVTLFWYVLRLVMYIYASRE